MSGNLANAADRGSLAYRFRAKRDDFLKDFLLRARPTGKATCTIIDLGGAASYWERVGLDWLEQHGFAVTCLNNEEHELTRDTTSGGRIKLVIGDACNLDLADGSFDIVHSNSVIEHVGMWPKVKDFSREVRRVAPAYYVQCPYFWFPIDPHFYRVPFLHWLPPGLRADVHRLVKAGWADRAINIDKAMTLAECSNMLTVRQMRFLFPDADLQFERVALLPKSIIVTRL